MGYQRRVHGETDMAYLITYILVFFLFPPLLFFLLINDMVIPVPEMTQLKPRWWGKGEGGDDDISLKPFTFAADKEQLEDLKKRIK